MPNLAIAKSILASRRDTQSLSRKINRVNMTDSIVDKKAGYRALKGYVDSHHAVTIARWKDPVEATVTFIRPPVDPAVEAEEAEES